MYNYPHFCAEFAVSIDRKPTLLGKVLDYVIKHSQSNVFDTSKGRRSLLISRLCISISSYERAMVRLCELKLLKKLRNESGGPYCYYEITALCWQRVQMASMLEGQEEPADRA